MFVLCLSLRYLHKLYEHIAVNLSILVINVNIHVALDLQDVDPWVNCVFIAETVSMVCLCVDPVQNYVLYLTIHSLVAATTLESQATVNGSMVTGNRFRCLSC